MKEEPTEFANGMDVECERKKDVKATGGIQPLVSEIQKAEGGAACYCCCLLVVGFLRSGEYGIRNSVLGCKVGKIERAVVLKGLEFRKKV